MFAVGRECSGSTETTRETLFVDKRRETHPADLGTPSTAGRSPIVIDPDLLASFDALPFVDESFALVVFDPPHVVRGAPLGIVTKKYGTLSRDWQALLRRGFEECFRVLRQDGTLIFKWGETDVPVSQILRLTPHKPLFGQRTKAATHWVVFMKGPA